MKDYRGILIMSDLDGTFMGSGGRLVARNMEALARFMAGGGRFSFATGRVHTTIGRFLLPEWKSLINCPAIMCNGVCCYDPGEDKLLFESAMDGRLIKPLLSPLFAQGRFKTNFYACGDYTCYENVAPEEIASDLWHKAVFVGHSDDVLSAKETLLAQSEGRFRVFRTGARIVEVLPCGAGKGPMLKRLKQFYAAQGEKVFTVGVGDFENDMDLLAEADVGIAPENALDEVKAHANRVMCSNNEGVIADIIEAIDRGEWRIV